MKLRMDVTNFVSEPIFVMDLRGQADVDVDSIVRAMQQMGPGDLANFVQLVEDTAADLKPAVPKPEPVLPISYVFTDEHGTHVYSTRDNAYRARARSERVGNQPSAVQAIRPVTASYAHWLEKASLEELERERMNQTAELPNLSADEAAMLRACVSEICRRREALAADDVPFVGERAADPVAL